MKILGGQKGWSQKEQLGKVLPTRKTLEISMGIPYTWVESLHMQDEAGETKQRRITMQT